jgi:hypothetical protein
MSHAPLSPWPQHGRRVRLERNHAYRVTVSYGGKWQWWAHFTGHAFSAKRGRWWFFSFDLGWLHGYLGFKPISLLDPQFDVPAWFKRYDPAVEFSQRLGIGAPA